MKKINHTRIVWGALFTLMCSACLMFLFESSKQLLFPHITLWQSHVITIIFVSILSFVSSYFFNLSKRLKKLYQKELIKSKNHEHELIAINKTHESTIDRRTESLKHLNNELYLAVEKAEESNKLKTAFLQNISHEIRTPLNAIMGFSQLIETENLEKETIISYATIIRQRGSDLLELVDDILVASRLETGKMPVKYESFSIITLFEELKKKFDSHLIALHKRDVTLEVHVDCALDMIIVSDKNIIKHILSNLLNNACKNTYLGKIDVGCSKLGEGNFTFYVSDTGIGIEEKNLEIIFEKFTRVENILSFEEGFGLGLAIVKGFVELLEGTIQVNSTIGIGSIFTCIIPSNKVT